MSYKTSRHKSALLSKDFEQHGSRLDVVSALPSVAFAVTAIVVRMIHARASGSRGTTGCETGEAKISR